MSGVLPGTPEYDDNRHQVEMDIEVLPSQRRNGIGSGWLQVAAAYAESRGARLLTAWSDSDSGQAFLGQIAEPRFRDWESRLFFERARWDVIERWAAIDRSAWRLERYEPFPPEPIWERYAPQYTELARHVPKEELEEGDWIVTTERLRDTQARFAEQRKTLHVLAAWDDEGLAGVTELLRSEHDPGAIDQELTAVHPRARGRGLAKLIKARLLLELRDRYPEARFVRTYNAGSNDAMWGINEAMGFERYRFGMAFQTPVARLRRP
jgi:GNAT superfamily N-acetyltransferase